MVNIYQYDKLVASYQDAITIDDLLNQLYKLKIINPDIISFHKDRTIYNFYSQDIKIEILL